MQRRLLLFFYFLIFSSFFFKEAYTQTQKPNIILILGDDVGYNIPGCNGGTKYSTPNLDSMATKGMRFTQCYSSPLCSPSRNALLTGKYNFRNYFHWGVLNQTGKTLGNVFKDAGYKTACYGKWQFDGGDSSVHTFGFDNYCIWRPYQDSLTKGTERIYKNPSIFQNGQSVANSITTDDYGEDVFTDSLLNFIDNNKLDPFFIYYPMVLVHGPFQPTPDDSAYYGPNDTQKDTSFYKSMVHYMDKKIGLIISKVKSLGLEDNTIILFAGDNGTAAQITETNDDENTGGGKGATTRAGTHVPLIAYGPGKIPMGTTNDNLTDFTDFFPTMADIANSTANYDPIDGVSFSQQLLGEPYVPREWVFNYYNPFLGKSILKRWAQTIAYKLYDSLGVFSFYDILNDVQEEKSIPDTLLTLVQRQIKQKLKEVLDYYAAQSPPVLKNATVSNVTDTSAILGATITDVGGFSSVYERGTSYNKEGGKAFNNLTLTDSLAEGNTIISSFEHIRTRLSPQTLYFIKGYAINNNGTGVSPLKSFHTLSKGVIESSSTFLAEPDSTSIKLNWSDAMFPNSGATKAGYLLIYSTATPSLVALPNGLRPSAAVQDGTTIITAPSALPAQPATSATLIGITKGTKYNFLLIPYTWDGTNAATYNYFAKGAKTTNAVTLHDTCVVPAVTSAVTNVKCNGSSTGAISITVQGGSAPFKFFWSGPNLFSSSLRSISNLTKGAYHLTVTAKGGCALDTTYDITEPPMLNISATADSVNCNGSLATVTATATGGSGSNVYTLIGGTSTTGPQTSNKFMAGAGKYQVIVDDSFNCNASASVTIYQPPPLKVSATADTIFCNGDSVTLTAISSGGNEGYLYTLLDGQKTTGPQIANTFTVSNGTYIVTVQDLKNCRSADTVKVLSCLPDDAFILTIYPNPGIEDFVLTIQTKSTEKIEYFITDLMGKRLLFATGVANEKIHFGKNLPVGMYYVTVIQGEKRQVLKVLKYK